MGEKRYFWIALEFCVLKSGWSCPCGIGRICKRELKMKIAAHWFLASDERMILLSVVAVSGIGFLTMRTWLPSLLERIVNFMQGRRFWLPFCVVLVVAYVVIQVYSTAYLGYLGHVEPNIASVSFILLKGAPLYHSLSSAQRYSVLYGPFTYLPYTLALRAGGANILSLKLVVLLANLCLLWLLWCCYRKLLDASNTLLLITVVVAFFQYSPGYVFEVRGDILIVLSVALGLFAVLRTSSWVSAFLLALACGVAFDIKFTALFYFVPLYVLFIRRYGWRPAAWASIGAGAFALAPFLFPQISVVAYLQWLHVASRHPISRGEIARVLKVLVVVCSPFALLLWQLAQRGRSLLASYLNENRSFLLALGSCVAAVAVSASTIGAGPHHLMPFYPLGGYVCADVYRKIKAATVARSAGSRLSFIPLFCFWLATALATRLGTDFPSTVSPFFTSRSRAVAVTSDLDMVMKDHPGAKIEMGYGDWNKYELTYFRPALVFAGNPLTIDPDALDDMQLSGVDNTPRSTLEYLKACKTQIWLIPKGDPPFVMVNVFSLIDSRVFPARPLFSNEFRRIFFEHYRKQGSSNYFDIWECGTGSDLPAGLTIPAE
jgi:hypothetical protein